VAFNDVQTETAALKIKDTEKPLKIETVTFRDKLEPNSKEKWTVKVTGNDKRKSMQKYWRICMICLWISLL
jgi:hypothetical protein